MRLFVVCIATVALLALQANAACVCCAKPSQRSEDWQQLKSVTLQNLADCTGEKAKTECASEYNRHLKPAVKGTAQSLYPHLAFATPDPLPKGKTCSELYLDVISPKAAGSSWVRAVPKLAPLGTSNSLSAASAAIQTAVNNGGRTPPNTPIGSARSAVTAPLQLPADAADSVPPTPPNTPTNGKGADGAAASPTPPTSPKRPDTPVQAGVVSRLARYRPASATEVKLSAADQTVPVTATVVQDEVAQHVTDPFLQALGRAALQHDGIMDSNFAYHDSIHGRTVARGAKKYAALFGASQLVQEVSFVAGLFHDTGYEEAVQANGYKLPADPAFSWDTNTVKTAFPANKMHEEFSLCWAIKVINQLLESPKWKDHSAIGGVDIDEVIGMIWAGILVTKVSGPKFPETAFESLANLASYGDGVKQPVFNPSKAGSKCKIEGEITKLYTVRKDLKTKLIGTYLPLFTEVEKNFGKSDPLPPRHTKNIHLVTLAMRAADFQYYTEPGSVCISENCRMEWTLYGGTTSMLPFPSAGWATAWEAAKNAPFAEKHLLLAQLFWEDKDGNGGFIKAMTQKDNPILYESSKQVIDTNIKAADDIMNCLKDLMARKDMSAEQKLAAFTNNCIQKHCKVSTRKIIKPTGSDSAAHKHWWATYGNIYEPRVVAKSGPPAVLDVAAP